MFLLSLTATCQVWTVSLKAGLYTYNGFARGALDTPDGETTQSDASVMRVACQAPAVVTGRFMPELKAKGQEKGEDTLDKGLRVAKQLKVGGFILKINGDGAVVPSRFGWACPVSPSVQMSVAVEETPWR